MSRAFILALDQGTTSTRAVVYDAEGRNRGAANKEFRQHYPQPGWVEHDAEEIWQSVAEVVPQALQKAGIGPDQLAAIGLTNQRETVVLWDRASGRPVAPAIVWQDRRTASFCRNHVRDEPWLRERTGLVLDPYFSATKIHWLLEHNPTWREQAQAGKLACGTIDSFLIWRLTGGRVHATDVSNASRTLLFNLRTSAWDEELCRFFEVPMALLPQVRPSAADYGQTAALGFLPAGLPIAGVAGDQQAALFGQRATQAGEAKCTYGTGAFFLLHTGDVCVPSANRLLTTFAATLDEKPQYALEGSVFIAGAAVQWLRDGLKLIDTAPAVEALANIADPQQPVVVVPALVGMGAPHWIPESQGAIFGLTRGTTAAELARATLEGVALQVGDLIDATNREVPKPVHELRVDGGMTRNATFLQMQADLLGVPVIQAAEIESTAQGAAFLAGLQVGLWPDLDTLRRLPSTGRRFEPRLSETDRQRIRKRWQRAVAAVIRYHTE